MNKTKEIKYILRTQEQSRDCRRSRTGTAQIEEATTSPAHTWRDHIQDQPAEGDAPSSPQRWVSN